MSLQHCNCLKRARRSHDPKILFKRLGKVLERKPLIINVQYGVIPGVQ
jgi:hypothetical protein